MCLPTVVSNMEERERREESYPESDSKDKSQPVSSTPQGTENDSSTNRDSKEHDFGADEDVGAKLDVSSDKFDPLLALYSPTVTLPFPNIKCFNNIAEYESFLKGGRGRAKPENVEKKRRKASKGVADPERIERLRKLMVHNVPEGDEGTSQTQRSRRHQRAAKNVLTRMPLHKGSPLGQLHRCVEERIRVKVHIRTFKGLRGVCSGFIVAFDKFWNMAMVDVDETYRETLLGEAFYHEKALTVTRLMEKLKIQESPEGGERKHTGKGKPRALQPQPQPPTERQAGQKSASQPYGKVHTRHINQLFIRGENVLVVNLQPC
ncbi:U7 snRNA-associated Sm-like protein LSm11 [Osmerus eperlanus]|uniref:U7 snRNA-associated Sm-like protein LSm11 n=1 Tax=Osmerus eperlanus TaxID=29151 RepID=UPI002E0E91B1